MLDISSNLFSLFPYDSIYCILVLESTTLKGIINYTNLKVVFVIQETAFKKIKQTLKISIGSLQRTKILISISGGIV